MHLCFLITSLEIIQLVEKSHLSARQTLVKLGIPRTTFYRWYNRYLQRGEAGLQDRSPKPKHVWNRVPDEVKRKVVDFALKETELSRTLPTKSKLNKNLHRNLLQVAPDLGCAAIHSHSRLSDNSCPDDQS